MIAIIASNIRTQAGPQHFVGAFGAVFAAWGLAGALGPISAGLIFDAYGDDLHAVIMAICLMLAGAVISLMLRDHEDCRSRK